MPLDLQGQRPSEAPMLPLSDRVCNVRTYATLVCSRRLWQTSPSQHSPLPRRRPHSPSPERRAASVGHPMLLAVGFSDTIYVSAFAIMTFV